MSSVKGGQSAGECMDEDSVCQTEKEAAPWVAFDFGHEVEVGSVLIFTGDDNGAGEVMNLDVRMTAYLPEDGRNKSSAGTLLGSFNGTLEPCQRILIKSPMAQKGRFVFIQMNPSKAEDYLSFPEVLIFGPKEELPGLFEYLRYLLK